MTEYTSLEELTGQESGIVIYGVGSLGVSEGEAEMLICNWTSVNGLPRLDPTGFIPMGLNETFSAIEQPDISDIGDWLEMTAGQLPGGINLIYDYNDDLKDLPGTPGKLYYIYQGGSESGISVIAPEGWA